MTELYDDLERAAQRAIAEMRAAARAARDGHARAELLRHVMQGAAKRRDRPRADAVAEVVAEWLAAWKLDGAGCAQLPEMRALVGACHDAQRAPAGAGDRAVREAFAALEAAFEHAGTTLADQMAWRSGCAHGWWAAVRPAPGTPARPFWEAGCPPHCA
jgi:hypothetical protein